MKKNLDIRIETVKAGLNLCQVADAMGMDRVKFWSWLWAKELPQADKNKVLDAIEGLKDGRF